MSVPGGRGGAIYDFDLVRFGGPTRVKEFDVAVATTIVNLIENNPDRVMVIMTNNGPDTLYWSGNGNLAFPAVNQLASGQQEVFQVQNDGALTGIRLFGLASVAACAVHFLVVDRYTRG